MRRFRSPSANRAVRPALSVRGTGKPSGSSVAGDQQDKRVHCRHERRHAPSHHGIRRQYSADPLTRSPKSTIFAYRIQSSKKSDYEKRHIQKRGPDSAARTGNLAIGTLGSLPGRQGGFAHRIPSHRLRGDLRKRKRSGTGSARLFPGRNRPAGGTVRHLETVEQPPRSSGRRTGHPADLIRSGARLRRPVPDPLAARLPERNRYAAKQERPDPALADSALADMGSDGKTGRRKTDTPHRRIELQHRGDRETQRRGTHPA